MPNMLIIIVAIVLGYCVLRSSSSKEETHQEIEPMVTSGSHNGTVFVVALIIIVGAFLAVR